jgi:hypothetical protein
MQVLSAAGYNPQVTPVMGHPISFAGQERTMGETLQLIIREVAKVSGKQVTFTWDPFTLKTAVDQSARDAMR